MAHRSSTAACLVTGYRFVDCRWSLEDPSFGANAYREGHIPGAVFVDVATELAAPGGSYGRHPLPQPDAFEAAMSRAGVDHSTFVVAYGSLGGAERLWWLLRHSGHDHAAVIGLEAWRGPFRSGSEEAPAARFRARVHAGDTIELPELARTREQLVVLDARLPPRFAGEPNSIDVVPGRIPGALNTPWNQPLPELPDGEVVVYCGSGITACAVLHRLSLAGRSARLYPGSWSEWERHPELPRASG